MEETDVNPSMGKHVRVYCGATAKIGGFRTVKSSQGMSKHLTVVIAISISGRICPQLFIITGKRILLDWYPYKSITTKYVVHSFQCAGVFLLNPKLLLRFQYTAEKARESGVKEANKLHLMVSHPG